MIKDTPVFFQMYLLPGKEEEAKKLLSQGGNPQLTETFFDFKKIPTVHFARWLFVPGSEDTKPSICYSGNVNGSYEQHLKDLVETMSDELDAILSLCKGYPAPSELTPNRRMKFLDKNFIKTPGFYAGAPNRSVDQINKEAKLHEAIRDYVKENGSSWKSSLEGYNAIKKHFSNDPNWSWVKKKYKLPKINFFKVIVLALFCVIPILPFYILALFIIHLLYEKKAKPFGITINDLPLDYMANLKKDEGVVYQNQISQIFEMKGGTRRLMLKYMLWLTDKAAKYVFVKGSLAGTPTIHFARWVIIDGGKRFLFFSNFDGSFDGYLGDFVDNNGWGLNIIYGAAKGYPRTFFAFGQGSYNIQEFMGWGRKTQIPTQIWYSAYPYYGLQQIINKTHLRVELFSENQTSEEEAKETLRRI